MAEHRWTLTAINQFVLHSHSWWFFSQHINSIWSPLTRMTSPMGANDTNCYVTLDRFRFSNVPKLRCDTEKYFRINWRAHTSYVLLTFAPRGIVNEFHLCHQINRMYSHRCFIHSDECAGWKLHYIQQDTTRQTLMNVTWTKMISFIAQTEWMWMFGICGE